MPKMIAALFDRMGQLDISKVYRTAPENLNSDNYFLNAAVRIESELNKAELKKWLVGIEEHLGRDRSDPDKKIKDRTADIDILFCLPVQQQRIKSSHLPEEVYMQQPLVELLKYLRYEISGAGDYSAQPGVELMVNDWSVGTKEVSLRQRESVVAEL